MESVIIKFSKIKYYKLEIKSKAKYHIISGHQTSMANIRLFYNFKSVEDEDKFNF